MLGSAPAGKGRLVYDTTQVSEGPDPQDRHHVGAGARAGHGQRRLAAFGAGRTGQGRLQQRGQARRHAGRLSTPRRSPPRSRRPKADLAAAEAALANQEAALIKAEAVLQARRAQRRAPAGAWPRRASRPVGARYGDARSDVAKADIAVAKAQIASAKATIQQRKAALDQAHHRSRAHRDPLAHRGHGHLAHRRSGPDRGGEPAGAGAVQDRAGSVAHPHRGPGQRGRRRRGQPKATRRRSRSTPIPTASSRAA